MKIEELMIGDFIFDKGKEIHSVYGLDEDENGRWWYYSPEHQAWCAVDEANPIPLTLEILEKNGFERCVSSIARTSTAAIPICDSNQFCHKDLGNLRIIDKHPCHGWTLKTDVFGDTCHNELHHIYYVHELQHALKLCDINKKIML